MLLHLTALEASPDLAQKLTNYCRDMALPVRLTLDSPRRLLSGDGEEIFSYVADLQGEAADKVAAKRLISSHPEVRSLANAL